MCFCVFKNKTMRSAFTVKQILEPKTVFFILKYILCTLHYTDTIVFLAHPNVPSLFSVHIDRWAETKKMNFMHRMTFYIISPFSVSIALNSRFVSISFDFYFMETLSCFIYADIYFKNSDRISCILPEELALRNNMNFAMP